MKKEIIYSRESLAASIISDTVTFGVLALLAWLNYAYLGNSWMYQAIIAFVFFAITISHSSSMVKRFNSRKELLDYLNSGEE